jgi:SAM-dependent methyltransferase
VRVSLEGQSSEEKNLLSLSETCGKLSISIATGRNWIKLGKLLPAVKQKQTVFFSKDYVEELKQNLQSGKTSALKSRRNKKYVSGNGIYQSYISESSVNWSVVQDVLTSIKEQTKGEEGLAYAILAECALQLLWNQFTGKKFSRCLQKFLKQEAPKHPAAFLIEELLFPYPFVSEFLESYPELFDFSYIYEEGEDLLGLLYLSLRNIENRKATGAYYTPTTVVKSLCSHLFLKNEMIDKDILDPCCGTGNFLLQLPSKIRPEHVYGIDIDPISIKLARINYALKYQIFEKEVLYDHLMEGDYLSFFPRKGYDMIIGNPPWGYAFSEEEKKQWKKKYQAAHGTGIESYDIFVEQALADLKPNGVLAFVLPEAFLNVKTHKVIRELLLCCCSIQYLEFLGDVFDGVQCPSIILQVILTGSPFCSLGMTVKEQNREYIIWKERKVSPVCLSFTTTDEEYTILEKLNHIPNKVTLAGNSKFALGIVTGNNKVYLSSYKTAENEPILKGADLYKFRYQASKQYIKWNPDLFQQVAPEELYRASEKLLYRFICNQLVFSYDDSQTLSLNSGNIVIPEIKGLSMKYIMAVFNARPAQFYFKKQFQSVKVLRSHIEQIPIPTANEKEQEHILTIVEKILTASDTNMIQNWYERLDRMVAQLYGLTMEEYNIIKASTEGENLFLYSPEKHSS